MSSFGNRRSVLAFVICLIPAFVLASPSAPRGLSRRDNSAHLRCGNAPKIIAGYPVTTADIDVPSQDEGPPTASTEAYLTYLWCAAGTSTYVFIDPIGNWGYNKGTNAGIFATGLEKAWSTTETIMASNAKAGTNPPTGDERCSGSSQQLVKAVDDIAGNSGIDFVQIYVQNSNGQFLTWGILSSALTIMKDFMLSYPLYADTSYFQINDGKYGTIAIGYVGAVFNHTTGTSGNCYLKGNVATGTGLVPCAVPSDYPAN